MTVGLPWPWQFMKSERPPISTLRAIVFAAAGVASCAVTVVVPSMAPTTRIVRNTCSHRTLNIAGSFLSRQCDDGSPVFGGVGSSPASCNKHAYTERTRVYQAPAAACNACHLEAQCTDSSKARHVN